MRTNRKRRHPGTTNRAQEQAKQDLTTITFTETHPDRPVGEQTESKLLTYDEARERLVVIGVLGRSS